MSAVGVTLQAAGTAAVLAVPEGQFPDAAIGAVAAALVVGYLLVLVATPLDAYSLPGNLPWDPSTAKWGLASLVPLLSSVTGAAYCLRRRAADRGTVPGGRWYYLVVASAVAWSGAFVVEVVVDHVALPLVDRYLFGPLVLFGLFVGPLATYLDAAHVGGHTDWSPRAGLWAVGAAAVYLGALASAGFLVRRRRAFAAAEDPATVSLAGTTDADERGQPWPPWFRGAVGVFGAYFVLYVLLALAVGGTVSEAAIEFAALLLWPPFGLLFAGCVYRDAPWRRDNDREVGSHWYLYLASALVPAVAMWYVLRRFVQVDRSSTTARSHG